MLTNHLKDAFLARLREPLSTTLALTDFSQHTIEQVVAHVLALDRAHHNNSFSMCTLQTTLPTTEDTRFRQALQCTTCAKSGHLAIDCPLRPHYPICHSRVHIVEQCEYNMLNRTNLVLVQQIEPRHDCSQQDERPPPWNRGAERPWEDDRLH